MLGLLSAAGSNPGPGNPLSQPVAPNPTPAAPIASPAGTGDLRSVFLPFALGSMGRSIVNNALPSTDPDVRRAEIAQQAADNAQGERLLLPFINQRLKQADDARKSAEIGRAHV